MGCGASKSVEVTSIQAKSPPASSDPENRAMEEASPLMMEPDNPEGVSEKILPVSTRDKIVNKYLNAKAKEEFAQMTIEELLAETELRWRSLTEVSDFNSADIYDDLLYVRAVTGTGVAREIRITLANHLSEWGLTKLFLKIWAQGFGKDLYAPEKKPIRLNMKFCMIILWNCTDKSQDLCQKCVDDLVYVDALKYLKDPVLDPDGLDDITNVYFIKGLLGILHNVIQSPECEAREPFREYGAFETLQRLRSSKNAMIRCKCELLLAYIINEDENEIINSSDSSFAFLLKILDDALMSEGRQSKKWGFQAVEIIMGLNRLAANDSNKVGIVKQGALPYYVKLLQPECTEKEQMNAARGLWILAFKCREDIQRDEGCLEGNL